MSDRADRRAVALAVVLFAAAYAVLGLFRHWHFGSSGYDLGIFDQALWHASRFEAPASSVRGVSTLLGDHFHPIMGVFVPLYWVVPMPEGLIVGQAVLFAVSIVPVFLFLRGRLPRPHAIALSASYGLFWGMQRAAEFDVHELAFAPLIIATIILALDRRQWRLFWTAAVALVFVKEDLVPFLIFLGVFMAFQGERRRGLLLSAGATLAFVVIMSVVMPAMKDGAGNDYAGAFHGVLSRPWTIPAAFITPAAKLRTIALWLGPFLFLPLASPLGWLLLPVAATRLLSDVYEHWAPNFHYSAPLAPILAMAAGDGLARLTRRFARLFSNRALVRGMLTFVVLATAILPGQQPFWDILEPSHYRSTPLHRAGYRALATIPSTASVLAHNPVVPHLSHRDHLYVLGRQQVDADFVIANPSLSTWPFDGAEPLMAIVNDYRKRGYGPVFEEEGWIVLKR